jgi:tetratricopeptide (TPR) repeat protein
MHRGRSEVSDDEWSDLIELFRAVVNETRSTSAKLDALRAIAEIEAYERGRHGDALALIDAIELPVTISESLSLVKMRADIHLLRGDLDSAVVAYRRFIERSSAIGHGGGEQVTEARLRLAELYLFEGKIDEGIDSLRSLASDPTSAAMNDAMEWLMIIEENRSKGESLLASYLAGTVAFRREEWEEVDKLMSRVYEADRRGTIADDALYYRAVALLARGRDDDGRELFERIVSDHAGGTHADRALLDWARSWEAEGELAEAERIYRMLLERFPHSIEAGEAREGLRRIGGSGS